MLANQKLVRIHKAGRNVRKLELRFDLVFAFFEISNLLLIETLGTPRQIKNVGVGEHRQHVDEG